MGYSVADAMDRRRDRRQERNKQLIERWAAQAARHEHVAVTRVIPASETSNGVAIDEGRERRCHRCGKFMGLAV